jgi:hypothetical protein
MNVLIIAWRRPNHLKKVIDAVRKASPKRVFVAIDGPREGEEYTVERELIENAKAVINKNVDWDCELKLNYQERNLGCRVGVSTAITWFFENVEEGIILEDDCVPSIDFFRFAGEMLVKYRFDDRIMHIAGNNFNVGRNFNKDSYYFSKYNHMWGWATWKRAWKKYNFSEQNWLDLKETHFLKGYLRSAVEVNFWTEYFEEIYILKTLDTWDYVWRLNIWSNSGLTITPNVNLVTNIGFDELAVHTKGTGFMFVSFPPIIPFEFPIRHPKKVILNTCADDWTFRNHIARKYCKKHSLKNRFILNLKIKLNWLIRIILIWI